MPRKLTGLMVATGVAALVACRDGGPPNMTPVAVGVAASTATPAAGASFASEVQTDGDGHTLVIDSVAVVLRKIKLENAQCGEGDSIGVHDSTEVEDGLQGADGGEGEMEGEDDCPELRLGPMLVDLPLGDGVAEHQFTASVPVGTYASVLFQLHKPDGDNDAAFLADHPEFAGVSIRVVGSFDGTPFVYTTGVADVQRVRFSPPLVVGDPPTAFTLFVDLSGWFRTGAGALIDPATALGDGANVVLVHMNIEHSFHAFQDEDHDGEDDHMEGGGH